MTLTQETESSAYQPSRSKLRFAKYAAGRLVLLSITVVAGLCFALLGANLGGKIDELHWSNIYWGAAITAMQDPAFSTMTPAQRAGLTREIAMQMGAARGLDRHITVRVAEWLPQGLTLQLGESSSLRSIRLRMRGNVLNDAIQGGALYAGHYHWILQPAFMLMLTTFTFAMLGFTRDRVLNPRLREM